MTSSSFASGNGVSTDSKISAHDLVIANEMVVYGCSRAGCSVAYGGEMPVKTRCCRSVVGAHWTSSLLSH